MISGEVMANTNTYYADVVVIGGGPAGTTVASLLVEKGYSVCLLEKSHHPRFHIGESLLPLNMPILEQLGVLDAVQKIGVIKYAAEFNSTISKHQQDIFYFSKAIENRYPHAFEVKRAEFDKILFDNAKAKGVKTFEGVKVNDVDLSGENKRVFAVDEQAQSLIFEGRYVIDASGRDTFLANKLKLKQRNPNHQMTAVYGHFKHVERRAAKDEGNISIYWFNQGWIWLIPLADDVMSVGVVCYPEYLKNRAGSLEDFFFETLHSIPEIQTRMNTAELISEIKATGNYSYQSSKMAGEGYLLIGDAYAFVDPVFSSGVYLAMKSAVLAADLVDSQLSESENSAMQF
ncbi:MAG: FAD-dependent oxidoreductase, partial [Methylococcaceae bacterium]|nr:FAD-dependent oxidoreductase [Methylococcaceae bacterium]